MRAHQSPLTQIRLYEQALPEALFNRLHSAMLAIGDEKPDAKDTYSKTFWYARGSEPSNVAEEAVVGLEKLANVTQEYIGMEWWIGRLRRGKKLAFHFDRDLALSRKTGENHFPILSSVYYLNQYHSSPTVVLDQVPGENGKSKVPDKPKMSTSVAAFPNHYVVFPGNLRHGVIPDKSKIERDDPDQYRLTLLVNYWNQRPSAPICCDYDGSVYAALRE